MYKIKDMFDFNEENENQNNNKKDNTQIDRMKQLNETYNKRGEFLKESTIKDVDTEKLNAEAEKFRKMSSHRLINEEADTIPFTVGQQPGQGQTVSTFLPKIGPAANNAFNYIKPEEALEIAIKRAVESGTPINDLDLYDEVNWHLNNLGFEAKLPVDIKNAMAKIIGRDLSSSLGE
jgi:hypothetical protein